MPEYYLIPKKLARKAPFLARMAQTCEAGLFRAVFWGLRRMSLESAYRFAGGVFSVVGPHTRKAAKAMANLEIAFPEESEEWRRQTVRDIFRSLGYAAVELVKMDQIWDQRKERLEFVMSAETREHVEAGRPAIMFCAHVGPWQVNNLIARQYGLAVSTIYAPESNPVFAGLMAKLRGEFGVGWISSEEGARPLLRELQRGNMIGLAMDTRLDSGKLVPFFGREALTNTSAAGLALRTGASFIPVRTERLPGCRFRLTLEPPLRCSIPDAPEREQALDLALQVNQCFERWIRESPGEWICLKRRWPKAHKL
ncbi:lysophospholipid acyltransferase family protein [Haliea sp. E17]|uniref:lysophospholipid acyltransferase family protein n=1 Tax=Haliea sp. E17 TaxID=3401576 RepID=UPI003AAD7E0C